MNLIKCLPLPSQRLSKANPAIKVLDHVVDPTLFVNNTFGALFNAPISSLSKHDKLNDSKSILDRKEGILTRIGVHLISRKALLDISCFRRDNDVGVPIGGRVKRRKNVVNLLTDLHTYGGELIIVIDDDAQQSEGTAKEIDQPIIIDVLHLDHATVILGLKLKKIVFGFGIPALGCVPNVPQKISVDPNSFVLK